MRWTAGLARYRGKGAMSAKSTAGRRTSGRVFARGEFLKLGGAGLAGAAKLGAGLSCGGEGAEGANAITYAEGPDDIGTLQKLLDGFTRESGIRVRYREMAADATGYLTQLRTELQAGGADTTVVCWSRMCGLGSLETSLLDSRDYALIQLRGSVSPEPRLGPSSEVNKPPVAPQLSVLGGSESRRVPAV